MNKDNFGGDKKVGKSLFFDVENRFVERHINKVPKCLETYHLTLMTALWSGLIIVFGYFAADNINWLWLVSLMIFFQYVTDLFDGKVGKYRNTGLIKWGYYMDHFLDYIFLGSILVSYYFLLPECSFLNFFFISIIFIAFMINSFLSFGATNEFKIAYLNLGPTEIRLVFIIINTILIIFGITYLAQALPYVLIFSFLGLIFVVYRTQKNIWKIDMDEKEKNKS